MVPAAETSPGSVRSQANQLQPEFLDAGEVGQVGGHQWSVRLDGGGGDQAIRRRRMARRVALNRRAASSAVERPTGWTRSVIIRSIANSSDAVTAPDDCGHLFDDFVEGEIG